MYEELIKRLMYCRNNAAIITAEELVEIADKAADAIEELSKKVAFAPIDAYAGLKRKYIVLKADNGEDVPDCFVLRPAKDKAAVEALRAYAKATDNEVLAADIYRWVGPLPEPPREET